MNSNLGAGNHRGLRALIRPWRAVMKDQHTALSRSTQAQVKGHHGLADTTAGTNYPILWIDGVGGFLLIDSDEVLIGQAIAASKADICIVGDLSRQAAAIRRSEGDYLLQPLQPTQQNGRSVDRAQLLNDGDEIQLGNRVRFQFQKPNPLSGTARLDLLSLNRFKPNVNGIILLSDSCIIGPQAGSHISCPSWNSELLLFRHNKSWYFRTLTEVNVNNQPEKGQIELQPGMRMDGDDFSLSVEGST